MHMINLRGFINLLSKEKTNLMPLILLFIQYSFNAQHVSAVNTTIFRILGLTGCYFMGGIWFGECWRSASAWLWRCGVFIQSEALLVLQTPEDGRIDGRNMLSIE